MDMDTSTPSVGEGNTHNVSAAVGIQRSEPTSSGDLRGLLLEYLDFYRSVIAAKCDGLDPHELRGSRLPSGWTPAAWTAGCWSSSATPAPTTSPWPGR